MIPAELRDRKQWVVWRLELRADKHTKVPYQVNGRLASSTDPSTWTTYERAVEAAARFDGIGFVFSELDPYTGLDWDDCLKDGQLHPAVVKGLQWMGSYTEWSPSRTGVHTIVRGAKTTDRCKTASTPWGGQFEAYDHHRFFTCTGDVLPGFPAAIEERQQKLTVVLARLFPNGSQPELNGHHAPSGAPPPNAPDLLERHPRLRRIVNRQCAPPSDPSDSGWDYYLACEARRCGATDEEIEELIGHARGHDSKSRRPDYLRKTIDAAHRAEPEPGKPKPATGGEDPPWKGGPEDLGAWASGHWHCPDESEQIVAGRILGSGGDGSIMVLTLRNGDERVFPRLAELFSLDSHLRRASLVMGWPIPPLKKPEALLVAQTLVALCEGRTDPDAGRDEVEEWIGGLLGKAGEPWRLDPRTPGDGRWRLLHLVSHGREPDVERPIPVYVVAARDPCGDLWLPASQLMHYVRFDARAQVGWDELAARMLDLGFERREIQQREPGAGRAGEKLKGVFFVGRERWLDEEAA